MDNIVLDIRNLKKSFGSNIILNGINLKVNNGDTVTMLGKSGTGKSVILQNIIGLIEPDEGDILVLGKNIPKLKYKELRDIRLKIGFLFQSGALYDSMSVKENLEFPLTRHDKLSETEANEKIKTALDEVGLYEALDKMPSELSGGMRKRIALARTLILQPEIMLYDEPTTGLDPITSREISTLILKMQEKFKMSSLIVTHDMECARLTSNKIVILKDGKIAAEGSYEEISKTKDEFIKSFFE